MVRCLEQLLTKQKKRIIISILVSVLIVSIAALIVLRPLLTTEPKSAQLNVSISIAQTNVYRGGSLQAQVNVESKGNPENVTLSCETANGISNNLNPARGISNFTSTLTLNVSDSTPNGNQSVIVVASSGGVKVSTVSEISVLGDNELSPNVTVSGTVQVGNFPGFSVRLNQIEFVDNQTNSIALVSLPSTYPAGGQSSASGAYSVVLQNEHTYHVLVRVVWGPKNQEITPYTLDGGNLYAYAPAGNTTMPGQNFTLGF